MEEGNSHLGYLDASNRDFYFPIELQEGQEREGLCEIFARRCKGSGRGKGLLERLAAEDERNSLDDLDAIHGPAWDSRGYGCLAPDAKPHHRSDRRSR